MASHDAFAARLADVLATLEAGAMLGAVERRVRGLGALLQFACLAVPCDEAFVAIELEHLGRMQVPGVATAEAWRPLEVELSPLGTPFAYLFAGGAGHTVGFVDDDPVMAALSGVLATTPRQGTFAPVRLGAEVVGGVALLFGEEPDPDRALAMAERIADVAAGSIEAFRTERVLLELFAAALPELVAPDGETGFARGLERHIHRLRLTPEHRRRLALADVAARLAKHGEAEAALAGDLLARVERYVARLSEGQAGEDAAAMPLDFP